ncbi:MAG: CRISPR-associated endonuclease Cas2 [Gammaproteobacteria bacterium]|nr:CRISPR-associated endonuclease Cas2 [Gammaproteobacteria bacterium]MDQ7075109.1 CRISPR-associated endonuclease Cas2 [Gammaproteobacteria bacterium]
MKKRAAIIAYDISCDRRRYRVLKILKEWRLDGQKSVHECLLSESQAEELFLQLAEFIQAEDRLLLAWLHGHREGSSRGVGQMAVKKGIILLN